MSRFVAVHGHFYQPPREDPWFDVVPEQSSASPAHDWNERVTDECYAPNVAARVLDEDRHVVDAIDNYAHIGFDFGPTLLEWLERCRPEVYAAILAADRASRDRLGHGGAIAQAHGHLIMPLCSERDRATQVEWGVADFARRFGRDPAGMWLPETAVDVATLEALAAAGIGFTLLAPHQARRFRDVAGDWVDVEGAIDSRFPYRVALPSGRGIDLLFYDGALSRAIAFERALHSGPELARRLRDSLDADETRAQLAHVATDGESYGHHHAFGEMALAHALRVLRDDPDVTLTNHAAFLAAVPERIEVEIAEDSSWSCAHGIERWRSDCGCHTGGGEGWTQAWRAPLREALDRLRGRVDQVFDREAPGLLRDPEGARNDYVRALDLDGAGRAHWLAGHTVDGLDPAGRVRALRLLEAQRHGMSMFTSCGWFFNDVAGIETEQVLLHAARAAQLTEEVSGETLEAAIVADLARAAGNTAELPDAAEVWRQRVAPRRVVPARVAAGAALARLLGAPDTPPGGYSITDRLVESGASLPAVQGEVEVTDERTGAGARVAVVALRHGTPAEPDGLAWAAVLLDAAAQEAGPLEGDGAAPLEATIRGLAGPDGERLRELVSSPPDAALVTELSRETPDGARLADLGGQGAPGPAVARAVALALERVGLRWLQEPGMGVSVGTIDAIEAMVRIAERCEPPLDPWPAQVAVLRALAAGETDAVRARLQRLAARIDVRAARD